MMITNKQNMRDLNQWVCWRLEERDGKPTKIPYSPLTDDRASSTNSNTWASYSEAVSAYKNRGYDGIGFVFTKEDDFVGVDLDDCFDPETGEVEPWAQEIIDELDSYTEISPSGTGVHILARAALPDGRNRKGPMEIYGHSRYFTMSGRHLEGTPRTIEHRQEQILALRHRVLREPVSDNSHKEPRPRIDSGLSEQEILMKAAAADNGDKFRRLWAGKTSGYASESEADQALCSLLAFWTDPDPGRLEQLFSQSALGGREKWRRRADYRQRTIARALDGRTEFYEPGRTVPINMKGTNDTNGTNTDSREYKELVELPDAPPFPVDALPESCRRFVREAAVSIGCAPDLVVVPLLGLLSSAIGNSRQVQLKRGWKESAALFAVVVAEPGDKKTPAQKVALAPLWQAQKRLKKEYQEEYEVYEEELRLWEAERKIAAKDGEPAPPKPKEPVLRSVVVDDVTVERLADILDENPRGVTSAQDELSGWVLSMNQYKAGGKGADRQFWLRVWSNAPVKVDRKSRKVPAIIAEPWISVVGSIQPEILPELDVGRNDGMLDRFLYSYPTPLGAKHTDEEVSVAAEHAVLKLYEKLAELSMPESDGEPFPASVPMTKEAWEVFKELADELTEEAHALGFPGRLRGVWSKLEAYLARLSLILALTRVVETAEREQIEPRDVLAASVMVDYFKAQASRVFAELHDFDSGNSLAAALGEFLKECDGRWEGTATQLGEELAKRNAQGVPHRPEELSKKVRAMAARSGAVDVQDGYRGKQRVLRIRSPKSTIGSVGAVGRERQNPDTTNSTNSTDGDSEGFPKKSSLIRTPEKTPLISDEWEEV
jgi:putative DNA primase/helicase